MSSPNVIRAGYIIAVNWDWGAPSEKAFYDGEVA